MFGLGGQEIIIILLLVGLLFGFKHLPDLGKSLGSSIREFKKEMGSSASEKQSTEQNGDKPQGNEHK